MLCAAEQMYFGCDNGPKPACGTRPTNFCDDDALWLLVFTRLSVSSYASDFESLAHGYDICWEGAGCISPSSTLKTLRRISYPFSNQAILNGLESLRVGVSRQKAKVPVNSSENVQNDEFSTGKFGDGKVANNNMATDIKLKILQKKKKKTYLAYISPMNFMCMNRQDTWLPVRSTVIVKDQRGKAKLSLWIEERGDGTKWNGEADIHPSSMSVVEDILKKKKI